MEFSAGQITFPQLTRFEGWNINAGIVNITAIRTLITNLECGGVRTGDRVFITYAVVGTKQGVQGDVEFRVTYEAGGANMVQLESEVTTYNRMLDVEPWHAVRITSNTVGRVTSIGNLRVNLYAISVASNTLIPASRGQLYAYIIPGSV